jgi:hypothetical protein
MTDFSARADKAFSFAQEVPKQLMTLSTAIFALTLTFAEKIEKEGTHARGFLEWAWGFYLLAILLGITVLMALAGHIDDPPPDGEDTIYTPGLRLLAGAQIVAFVVGLVLTLVYGVEAT